MHRVFPLALALLGLSIAPNVLPSVSAAAPSASSKPAGLKLAASPSVADVGKAVVFTVTAHRWGGSASVTVSFVSPHHGFTGAMPWKNSCGCFQLGVLLAKRIHPLEKARGTARVTSHGKTFVLSTSFQIRGLAANGKGYAPGGKVGLVAWVGDPTPTVHEDEHICGWLRTVDGLGVHGYHVHFIVHYPTTTENWYTKVTDTAGVACSQRKVLPVKVGQKVSIDAYSAGKHKRVTFVVS